VLLVEQKLTIALEVADRCLVMGHGQIVFEGTPADLRANAYIRKEWLEVCRAPRPRAGLVAAATSGPFPAP
jgi:energy-coupling factor transporter ATP-binding protein EcfA2